MVDEVLWQSAESLVLQVSNPGDWYITVTTDSGASDTVWVHVTEEEILYQESGKEVYLEPGSSQRLLFSPKRDGYYYFCTPQVLINDSYWGGGYLEIQNADGTYVDLEYPESSEIDA